MALEECDHHTHMHAENILHEPIGYSTKSPLIALINCLDSTPHKL